MPIAELCWRALASALWQIWSGHKPLGSLESMGLFPTYAYNLSATFGARLRESHV